MVERGQYDEAFAYSVRKLVGKKNKKTKYVTALEEAYIRLNERDLNEIDFLMKKGSVASWDRVYYLYEKLEDRQNLVIPLMPLQSKDGYIAHFELKNYTDKLADVANMSADYHYNQAMLHLESARKGDKREARRAMTALNNIDNYFLDYKDVNALKREARDLGTEHIAVEFASNDNWILGKMALENISSLNIASFDTYWEKFHHYNSSAQYDNYVIIELDNIDLGREREFVNHSSFSKEIEDGYETVEKTIIVEKDKKKDGKGGKKDTVTKDDDDNEVKTVVEKKIRYRTVRAEIIEIKREKLSTLYGNVKVYNNQSDRPIYQNQIVVDFGFADEAVRLNGDRRALPDNIRTRLDEYINDFPSDYDVVDELAYNFKSAVKSEVDRFEFLYD
jgi:hypothetical protein